MTIRDNLSFTTIDEEGNERVCDVLITFDSNETHKSYILYTDNSKDEEGNTKVFASTYTEIDGEMQLHAIETEEEWDIVEHVLDTATGDIGDFDF